MDSCGFGHPLQAVPEALLDLMLSVALTTTDPCLHAHTPLSLTWANGEGQRAAILTRTLVCLHSVPRQRLRLGVLLLYDGGVQTGTMGTLYGILDTPLEDGNNHHLLIDICSKMAEMHRYGHDLHRVPHSTVEAPSDAPTVGQDNCTRLWSGEGWSMHMHSNVGEDTVLGIDLLLDPHAPCRTIREAILARTPPLGSSWQQMPALHDLLT